MRPLICQFLIPFLVIQLTLGPIVSAPLQADSPSSEDALAAAEKGLLAMTDLKMVGAGESAVSALDVEEFYGTLFSNLMARDHLDAALDSLSADLLQLKSHLLDGCVSCKRSAALPMNYGELYLSREECLPEPELENKCPTCFFTGTYPPAGCEPCRKEDPKTKACTVCVRRDPETTVCLEEKAFIPRLSHVQGPFFRLSDCAGYGMERELEYDERWSYWGNAAATGRLSDTLYDENYRITWEKKREDLDAPSDLELSPKQVQMRFYRQSFEEPLRQPNRLGDPNLMIGTFAQERTPGGGAASGICSHAAGRVEVAEAFAESIGIAECFPILFVSWKDHVREDVKQSAHPRVSSASDAYFTGVTYEVKVTEGSCKVWADPYPRMSAPSVGTYLCVRCAALAGQACSFSGRARFHGFIPGREIDPFALPPDFAFHTDTVAFSGNCLIPFSEAPESFLKDAEAAPQTYASGMMGWGGPTGYAANRLEIVSSRGLEDGRSEPIWVYTLPPSGPNHWVAGTISGNPIYTNISARPASLTVMQSSPPPDEPERPIAEFYEKVLQRPLNTILPTDEEIGVLMEELKGGLDQYVQSAALYAKQAFTSDQATDPGQGEIENAQNTLARSAIKMENLRNSLFLFFDEIYDQFACRPLERLNQLRDFLKDNLDFVIGILAEVPQKSATPVLAQLRTVFTSKAKSADDFAAVKSALLTHRKWYDEDWLKRLHHLQTAAISLDGTLGDLIGQINEQVKDNLRRIIVEQQETRRLPIETKRTLLADDIERLLQEGLQQYQKLRALLLTEHPLSAYASHQERLEFLRSSYPVELQEKWEGLSLDQIMEELSKDPEKGRKIFLELISEEVSRLFFQLQKGGWLVILLRGEEVTEIKALEELTVTLLTMAGTMAVMAVLMPLALAGVARLGVGIVRVGSSLIKVAQGVAEVGKAVSAAGEFGVVLSGLIAAGIGSVGGAMIVGGYAFQYAHVIVGVGGAILLIASFPSLASTLEVALDPNSPLLPAERLKLLTLSGTDAVFLLYLAGGVARNLIVRHRLKIAERKAKAERTRLMQAEFCAIEEAGASLVCKPPVSPPHMKVSNTPGKRPPTLSRNTPLASPTEKTFRDYYLTPEGKILRGGGGKIVKGAKTGQPAVSKTLLLDNEGLKALVSATESDAVAEVGIRAVKIFTPEGKEGWIVKVYTTGSHVRTAPPAGLTESLLRMANELKRVGWRRPPEKPVIFKFHTHPNELSYRSNLKGLGLTQEEIDEAVRHLHANKLKQAKEYLENLRAADFAQPTAELKAEIASMEEALAILSGEIPGSITHARGKVWSTPSIQDYVSDHNVFSNCVRALGENVRIEARISAGGMESANYSLEWGMSKIQYQHNEEIKEIARMVDDFLRNEAKEKLLSHIQKNYPDSSAEELEGFLEYLLAKHCQSY